MSNKLSKLSIQELEQLEKELDAVHKVIYIKDYLDHEKTILDEMFIRFRDKYTPPFKIGYFDGSGASDDVGYSISDANDETVILSSGDDTKIKSRIIAKVLVKLLNDHFFKE